MTNPASYRDFYYPLNVFMHVLTHEEGGVDSLHYGLFHSADEPIAIAQRRSTELVLERLPPAPAALLEVGVGLGTTLAEFVARGYDVVGITPDEKQIAAIRARFGEDIPAVRAPFESFDAGDRRFDLILFQESSQYIDSEALFARARALAKPDGRLLVVDEFAGAPLDTPGALHDLPHFLAAAASHGFIKTEEIDLSMNAAPTIAYFTTRLPQYRDALIRDLGLTSQQVDDLITSGEAYSQRYRDGIYLYRLLQFRA